MSALSSALALPGLMAPPAKSVRYTTVVTAGGENVSTRKACSATFNARRTGEEEEEEGADELGYHRAPEEGLTQLGGVEVDAELEASSLHPELAGGDLDARDDDVHLLAGVLVRVRLRRLGQQAAAELHRAAAARHRARFDIAHRRKVRLGRLHGSSASVRGRYARCSMTRLLQRSTVAIVHDAVCLGHLLRDFDHRSAVALGRRRHGCDGAAGAARE